MESNPESRDDMEKIVIEERNKPPSQAEARKWAKSHPNTACKICKENNLTCIPLESRVHCNTPTCKNSTTGLCSRYDDALFERLVKRFPSLERSTFDEILSRLPPLSFPDANSTPSTSSAQDSELPNKRGVISFKRKTPPTNSVPDSSSEVARLPPNYNPYAFYLEYPTHSAGASLVRNPHPSFENPEMQALKQTLDDQMKENGVLKAKLEETSSAEASLKDSNQSLEKAKAEAEAIIQNLREELEKKDANCKAADTRTREATILREGIEKGIMIFVDRKQS
ncbi:uncharacterized protein EV420DRAFT_146589 [Desarmillaria tabescens]|uniref:Uncharacterized protein n=1 Tax=Armillaria tabescens TaxID=1929756 RepID=A0AA39NAL6_ARMTA|nr:uncharacterized protein EV420DRAFT_146589 [Desarmillaria tabescens]KAK0462078.1 hypothetical protein EV420DRAFT_146589 [Desarmillaria tabescens]